MDNSEIQRAQTLARVLDTAVAIPGTRWRVGLDALIGLIPGGGDVISGALSSYIVLAAVRAGLPRSVVVRMLGNVVIDTVVGSVPLLGDIFDVAFKANRRNANLLEQYAARPEAVTRRSRMLGVVVVLVLALILVAFAALGFLLARFLWQLL